MAKTVTCKNCGFEGYWAQSKAGKWYISPDDGSCNLGLKYGMRATMAPRGHSCEEVKHQAERRVQHQETRERIRQAIASGADKPLESMTDSYWEGLKSGEYSVEEY